MGGFEWAVHHGRIVIRILPDDESEFYWRWLEQRLKEEQSTVLPPGYLHWLMEREQGGHPNFLPETAA